MTYTKIKLISESEDRGLIRRLLACHRWAIAHQKTQIPFDRFVREVLKTGVSYLENIILKSRKGKTLQ